MNLAQIFSSLVTSAKLDAERELLPLLANAATNLAANPSALNAAAVGSQLMVDAIAKFPTLEQNLLKDLATEINAQVQAALAATPKP